MAEKSLDEIEIESNWRKRLNKFLNDYFKWVIVLAVLIVLTSGFFFLIMPKYDQTTTYMNMTNQQERLDFEAKTQELNRIKSFLKAYDNIDKQYVDKVGAIAPVIKNKEELFSEINYLVSKNQLLLQSVTLGEVGDYKDSGIIKTSAAEKKSIGNLQEVSVNLFVRGTDYESFKNFLSALENNLRLMDVVSVNFDPVGKTTYLTINTYYSK